MTLICLGQPPVTGCGAILTEEERHWYGYSCEKCQQEWFERIGSWRRGGQDRDLDEMFSVPAAISH